MTTIPVRPYPIGPTFDSPLAAIQYGQRFASLAFLRSHAQRLIGSPIIDGCWTDTDFVLRFGNDLYLHVAAQLAALGHRVQFAIRDDAPALDPARIQRVGAAPVTLRIAPCSPVGMPDRHVMNVSALLAARRGREFRNLHATPVGLYLYTPPLPPLCVHCVERTDTASNVLMICDDN